MKLVMLEELPTTDGVIAIRVSSKLERGEITEERPLLEERERRPPKRNGRGALQPHD